MKIQALIDQLTEMRESLGDCYVWVGNERLDIEGVSPSLGGVEIVIEPQYQGDNE